MRDIAERREIAFCEGIDRNAIAVGDRVAFAIYKQGRGLRLGTVVNISGCFYDSKWRDIVLRVIYTLPRSKYNPATGQFEDRTRHLNIELNHGVVKVA